MNKNKLISIIAAGALVGGLSACTANPKPDPESGGSASPNASAGAFVECLKGKGVKARLSNADDPFVLVQANSSAVQMNDGMTDEPTTSIATSADDPDLMPITVEMDDEGPWFAFQNSRGLVDDPTAQAAYIQCEADLPDFTQPQNAMTMTPEMQEQAAAAMESGLEFAACARKEGFDWVTDPEGDPQTESPMIMVPESVSEDEFRNLLTACYDPMNSIFAWGTSGADGEKLFRILDEFSQR